MFLPNDVSMVEIIADPSGRQEDCNENPLAGESLAQ